MRITEVTVEELKEEIELLYFEHGVSELRFVENFSSRNIDIIVDRLQVETEQDVVMIYDDKDILRYNECVCGMFLLHRLKSIHKEVVDQKVKFNLQLYGGTVTISTV